MSSNIEALGTVYHPIQDIVKSAALLGNVISLLKQPQIALRNLSSPPTVSLSLQILQILPGKYRPISAAKARVRSTAGFRIEGADLLTAVTAPNQPPFQKQPFLLRRQLPLFLGEGGQAVGPVSAGRDKAVSRTGPRASAAMQASRISWISPFMILSNL